MIDSDTFVTVSENQVSSVLGDEEVILNLENGTYYGLNQVGARVWQLLQKPCTVAEICDVLQAEFDAGREQIQSDVLTLLRDMEKEGLIRLDAGSGENGS